MNLQNVITSSKDVEQCDGIYIRRTVNSPKASFLTRAVYNVCYAHKHQHTRRKPAHTRSASTMNVCALSVMWLLFPGRANCNPAQLDG